MTPDDTTSFIPSADQSATPAESTAPSPAPTLETPAAGPAQTVTKESLPNASAGEIDASMSAIASAKAGTLSATASAIGFAAVDGDASASLSAVGVMTAKGNASMSQSYASALVAGDRVAMSMAAAPVVMARKISFDDDDRGGALIGVAVASRAKVRRGFVGILLAGQADLAEDTRVLVTGRALWIVGAALFGGLALVAVALVLTGRDLGRQATAFAHEHTPSFMRR